VARGGNEIFVGIIATSPLFKMQEQNEVWKVLRPRSPKKKWKKEIIELEKIIRKKFILAWNTTAVIVRGDAY